LANLAPAHGAPGAILGLQRGAGNHATSGLIQRLRAATAGGVLRRCGGKTCPPGTCDHDGELRRNSTTSGPATAPPLVHQVLGAAGERLHPAARSYLEPRFGHDFSTIRVHTDATAAASAEAVGARAYTVGNHLAFATGAYAPHTEQGRRLIAHELAHTLQQGATAGAAGTTAQAKFIVGEPDHPLEQDADHVAEQVMRGFTGPEPTTAASPALAGPPNTVLRQGGTQPARTDPAEAARAAAWSRVFRAYTRLAGIGPPPPPGQERAAELGRLADQLELRNLARTLFQWDPPNMAQITEIVSAMRDRLAPGLATVRAPASDPECGARGAYVVGLRPPVHLCPAFFRGSAEERIETMIHEAAHMAGIGEPHGESYCGLYDCASSCGGFDVADSWGHFVHCAAGRPAQQNVVPRSGSQRLGGRP
jgi:hypothetical protein